MENCGFVEWVDAEWPENLKNSFTQLWTMYEDSENRHIETENKHAAMVYKLVEEKDKAERKYAMMNADVNKWIDGTVKRVMEENYHKIMKEGRDEDQLAVCEAEKEKALKALEEVKKQRSHLLVELQALKDSKSCDQEIQMMKEKNLEEEKAKLKEEKKKLEYGLYDMLKAKGELEKKLSKIKEICDE